MLPLSGRPFLSLICALTLLSGCAQGLAPGGPDGGQPDAGPRCGDGVVASGEECDQGAHNGPNQGCEKDCTFTCVPGDSLRGDKKCDPHDACKGAGYCNDHHVCELHDPLATGASCSATGEICRNGACTPAVCGDGIVTAPEECDDGTNDGMHGCGSDCRFVCVPGDGTRDCAATDPCQGAGTCDGATHSCTGGTTLGDGTACGSGLTCQSGHCIVSSCSSSGSLCKACGSGSVCVGGACAASTCGDGCVDASKGETCDPPDGTTCDAHCHSISHCGDGILQSGEQCDDGNLTNLDGCDSHCKFEQEQRANSIVLKYGVDGYCTVNALGGSIGSNAQKAVNDSIAKGVTNGSLTVAFKMMGLTDPTGGGTQTLQLGDVTGKPVTAPPRETYDGTKDLDWWYATDASTIDASRVPTAILGGSLASKGLTAGPGKLTLVLAFGGTPEPLSASSVRLKANLGAASRPLVSSTVTPGHLPGEHLDPALTTFASMTNGELCGNVSALSMQKLPVPQTILSLNCIEGFSPSNTLLDVFVKGCSIAGGFVTLIAPTQPDQVDPDAPKAGSGGPYTLGLSGGSVTSCAGSGNASVDLTTCLTAAAYSMAFTFTTDRVIMK